MNVFFREAGVAKKAAKSESKGKSGESDGRSIRLVSCVLGDADLQFFCSRNNREGERDREIESTFRGSGAETNREQAQGANTRHLQWDLAATVVDFFSGGNGVSDLHYAAFKLQCQLYYKVQKNLLYFQWLGLTWR